MAEKHQVREFLEKDIEQLNRSIEELKQQNFDFREQKNHEIEEA
jgi:ribosomal protein L29